MKKTLFLLTAVLLPLLSNAQVKKKPVKKEVEPIETPSRIKVYTPSGNSQSEKGTSENSYKWAVKTDIFKFVSGEFPVIFEYRIAPKFSVEGSAGLTYAFYPNDFIFTDENIDGSTFDSKAAMGSAFRAAIKYYPSSDYDAIEGWSFGVQLFYKTLNRDYNSGDYSDPATVAALENAKDTKIRTGISLIIGKQVFQDSNITIESFIGVGFASVKREYLVEKYNDGTAMNEFNIVSTKNSTPNVQFGCRIGFGN